MPIGSNGIKQERVVYKLYHLAGFYSWLKTGFLLSVVFLSIISVVNAATLTAGDLAPRGSPNGQLDAADLHIVLPDNS